MRKIHNQHGISIIEFMISMAILTTVTLGSFYVLTIAKHMSEDSRLRLIALSAARSTLEQVKNTALGSVSSMSTTSLVPTDLPSATIAIATNPSPVGSATVATVTVTVTWRGTRNRLQTLQVSTMRSLY